MAATEGQGLAATENNVNKSHSCNNCGKVEKGRKFLSSALHVSVSGTVHKNARKNNGKITKFCAKVFVNFQGLGTKVHQG